VATIPDARCMSAGPRWRRSSGTNSRRVGSTAIWEKLDLHPNQPASRKIPTGRDPNIWLASHYSMKSNAKVMLLIPHKSEEDDTFFTDQPFLPTSRASIAYFDSLMIASAALPATTQLADPATTASSSNHRNPKSSMHSGKSGLMMM